MKNYSLKANVAFLQNVLLKNALMPPVITVDPAAAAAEKEFRIIPANCVRSKKYEENMAFWNASSAGYSALQ
jgi:hypothetical protein